MSSTPRQDDAITTGAAGGSAPSCGYPRPYYQRDGITIYHGDCREIVPELPEADLLLADPPYGIGFVKGVGGRVESPQGYRMKRNTCKVYGDDEPFDPEPWLNYKNVILWGANHYASRLPHGRWIAWNKLGNAEPWDSFSDVEFAWQSGRGKDRIFSMAWKGLCQGLPAGKKEKRHHPTQKPVKLMRWCLSLVPDADTVLDPYMGSGSTLVACKLDGRKAIGIEIEERYCEIAAKRLSQGVLF